ncbi:MAG: tetratricopeptide repeat protein [Fimbriimonadaceae bacterium]|nr:tetratricopeptide repeat protein [Fimbriimonadaceae bacterium]
MQVNRPKMIGALVGCLAAAAVIHGTMIFPFWRKHYAVKSIAGEQAKGLSADQLLFALAGFRELVAGILWVRADSFFDEGNYDAILPIIRLVTWLDPHEIDVYATGMWHIGYNFTDEESRSDRRYIPSALALGKEGARANPNTYELFFETGWIWYHKVDDDYDKAVYWWEQAAQRDDIQPARRNILASAYIRDGKVEKALGLYEDLLARAEKQFGKSDEFQNRQNRDTIESNLDNLLVRMGQRGYFAQKGGYYDQGDYDTKPPFDVGFSARVTVEDPKVIKVEGTWNVLPVGTRVRIVLRDKNLKGAKYAEMDWDASDAVNLDPDKEITFMQDQLFVKNQQFRRRIDMSRDATMYPFLANDYVIEFYYNPRSAPAHIQDKFGFSGEGMTDQNFLNLDARPGQRVIYTTLEFSKDELLRRGKYAVGKETPVKQTANFKPLGAASFGDAIQVPGLRTEKPQTQNSPIPGQRPKTMPVPRGLPGAPGSPGSGVRTPMPGPAGLQ